MSKTFNFLSNMKQVASVLTHKAILTLASTVLATGVLAQTPQYGDLEATILAGGVYPATNIPVMAIDPDMIPPDTSYASTDGNGIASFEDLYIYTITKINENQENKKTFEGRVQFYSILGQYLDQTQANTNGSVQWDGAGHTAAPGIYLAKGENGVAIKFFYSQQAVLLGKSIENSQSVLKTVQDTFNSYELVADGRGLEFNPFDIFTQFVDLYANQVNYESLAPPIVPDGPASGEIEILVDGQVAGDSSEVKLVRSGELDTAYLYTTNGTVSFEAASHPFGNFTRTYTAIINSFASDSNLFVEESHEIEIALGNENNFTFNPEPIISYYGDLELIILGYDGVPTKAIDPDQQDTTIAYTVNSTAYFEDLFIYTTGTTPGNTYEIWADGRNLEWDPFDIIMEEHELFANQVNSVWYFPVTVPDGPASGEIEILVDGQAAGDNSEVKLVRTGETDTSYLYTTNGTVSFEATSHPFGNYTRDYTISINSFMADSNWFHQETNTVDIALGAGNNFTFTPAPITDEERTANITLEIILTNGNPASENAEVKTYRPGETDTTFAYTNENGIANFSRLVNPFQADTHEIAINSDACIDNLFIAMSESHDVYTGQNNLEMNPDPIPENFGSGPVRFWYGTGTEPNTEVNIWRLNNTLDTVTYITSTSGQIIYEDLPLEGSSSAYVFESRKEATNGNPVLTSLDTFNINTGFNPMLNIYLEPISQFITMTGNIKEFYDQSVDVAGVGIEVREANGGATIVSTTTDTNGDYSLSGIPANENAEIVMNALANHFDRIHAYTFPGVFVEDDTLLPNMNMLHIPIDMVIPQTANDPAPETLVADPAEVAELAYGDDKNGEELARFENRIYLTNFGSSSDSAIFFQAERAIDSLFYGGQGSPLVLVPNTINITANHILNYNISVGFPGELGWKLTQGGGNVTTPIHSSASTGGYILGGQIHIMGGGADGIKELEHRRNQLGDVTSRLSFGNPGNPTMPNLKDRAYTHAIFVNLTARVITGNEVFPLDGLTTSSKSPNKFQTGEMNQPYLMGPPKPKSTDIFEDAQILYETK